MISPHFCIHFTKPFPYFGHYMASEIVLGFLVAGLGSFAFWNTQLHSVATAFLRPTIISLLVSAYQESQLTTQSRCENPTKDRVQCGCGGLQWVHCTLTAGALTLCLGTKKVLEHIFSMCLWFFFFFFYCPGPKGRGVSEGLPVDCLRALRHRHLAYSVQGTLLIP